ncbi:tetratricopeptide repeat protein [Aliterella atlantica]|uniref:tetratricopeptide repeat protein n=1 Tax=Aliterella atlantica TaxID=1827278 RepID=UPI000698F8D3|nr:tetratricopeptide repeat protein [Aliterella atlantica]
MKAIPTALAIFGIVTFTNIGIPLVYARSHPTLLAQEKTIEALFQQGEEKFARQDFKGAVADWNEVIRRDPKYAYAYYRRGIARFILKDYQGADKDLTETIRLKPPNNNATSSVYAARGVVRVEGLKNPKGAIEDFNRAIKLNPQNATAYANRGVIRADNFKDNKGAIEDFNQSIKLNPENPDTYRRRGIVRYLLKDKKGAVEDLQQAAKLYQSQNDTQSYQRTQEIIKKLQEN